MRWITPAGSSDYDTGVGWRLSIWNQAFYRMTVFAIRVVLVIIAGSIVFTHRIPGPLSPLERTLEELAKGEDLDCRYTRLEEQTN